MFLSLPSRRKWENGPGHSDNLLTQEASLVSSMKHKAHSGFRALFHEEAGPPGIFMRWGGGQRDLNGKQPPAILKDKVNEKILG